MKLQDKINRRVGDKEYRRWYVNLSKKEIEQLEWTAGQELETKIKNGQLTLQPTK